MNYSTTCLLVIILLMPVSSLADHASANFETGTAGAVMTIPGSTMPQGKMVAGVNIQVIEFDAIPDTRLMEVGAADEDVHSTDSLIKFALNISYGLTEAITLGLNVPYIERHDIRAAAYNNGLGEVEIAGDAKGMGDASLFSQYRFLHTTDSDLALLAGIKTPSGSTSETENGGELFETDHLPGSGSWDPFLGLSFNHSWDKTGLSANILYTFATRGTQDTNLGDVFNYNIAVSRRMFAAPEHHHHEEHEHMDSAIEYVDLVLELNGDMRDKVSTGGLRDENHGGHLLYLSPGIKLGLGHHWTLYTSVGIPIVNGLNGIQSEPDYRIIGGLSYGFE